MSAQQTIALCIDCWEFHYGIPDANGVFSRESGSSNHWDHAVHVFGAPQDYDPPFRAVLTDLHSGMPISSARMEIFSLACAVTAIQPNNGRKVDEAPLGVIEHRAQMCTAPESAPEPQPGQLTIDDLLEGTA